MPKYLALYLDAPLMSWGDSSPTSKVRGTGMAPTLSAIHGLVACCMGVSSRDDKDRSAELGYNLSFAVDPLVLAGEPALLIDHQVSRGTKSLPPWRKHAAVVSTDGKLLLDGKVYEKHYVTGVVYGVVLQVSDAWAEKVGKSMEDPYWPPFLGRKCCIPSARIYRGSFDTVENARRVLEEACRDERA